MWFNDETQYPQKLKAALLQTSKYIVLQVDQI